MKRMDQDSVVTILPYRRTGSGMTTYSNYMIKALKKANVNFRVVGFGPPPEFIKEMGIPYFEVAEDPYRMDYLGGPMVTYAWIRKKLEKFISRSELDSGIFHFIYPGANFMTDKDHLPTVVTAWGFYSKAQIFSKSFLDFSILKYPIVTIGKLEHYYLDMHSYINADFMVGTTSETISFWKQRIRSIQGEYVPLPVEVDPNASVSTHRDSNEVHFLMGERDLERHRNNVWRILKAFEILFNRGYTNFYLHLVGGYGRRLNSTVERLRASGLKISLEKYMPKNLFDDLMNKCDVSLIPRYIMDQGGYWPLEAMARGSCTVASDLPAFKDFVLPGVNGLLVNPLSVDDIANKIGILLKDRDILLSLKKGALSRILEVHSLEVVGRQYAKIYNEVLTRR